MHVPAADQRFAVHRHHRPEDRLDTVTDRAQHLHTDIDAAGLPFLHRFVELALAFHHAVRSEDQDLAATISRLRELTATGDFAYFTDIAHFMAALPLPEPSTTR
ncbi:hypothetical protein, partial [Streptomyces sp. NPDC006510]|uniref:hypothetical protein n=1 Tax=Streptomyces sp. NPDC006510 TaxID=3155600 RepID=UPI0033A8ADCE